MNTSVENASVTLFGRSSSHFTRVTRIFAAELGVAYAFRPAPSLLSLEASDYGGNPALRLPVLHAEGSAWFGAANVCRELARLSAAPPRLVWPEDLRGALVTNAQELTLQAMSTEVTLIMAQLGDAGAGSAHVIKLRRSLLDSLAWLDANVDQALEALPPERDLSFLEVTLFCLITHLAFREVVVMEPYRALCGFESRFAQRPSAAQTSYRFDT